MKFILLFVIFLTLGLSQTFGGDLLQRDKATHVGASFTGQVLCSAVASEVVSKKAANLSCFLAINALGMAVESGALGPNKFEIEDLGANLVGSGLGTIVVEWKF